MDDITPNEQTIVLRRNSEVVTKRVVKRGEKVTEGIVSAVLDKMLTLSNIIGVTDKCILSSISSIYEFQGALICNVNVSMKCPIHLMLLPTLSEVLRENNIFLRITVKKVYEVNGSFRKGFIAPNMLNCCIRGLDAVNEFFNLEELDSFSEVEDLELDPIPLPLFGSLSCVPQSSCLFNVLSRVRVLKISMKTLDMILGTSYVFTTVELEISGLSSDIDLTRNFPSLECLTVGVDDYTITVAKSLDVRTCWGSTASLRKLYDNVTPRPLRLTVTKYNITDIQLDSDDFVSGVEIAVLCDTERVVL